MIAKPFIEKLSRFDDRVALNDRGRSYRYKQLHAEVVSQFDRIRNAGVMPGQVVFMQGDYSFEAIALFFALYVNGNIIALNSVDKASEHASKMEISCAHFFVDLARGTIASLPQGGDTSTPLLQSLAARAHAGLILFSSGSTGKPKAMLHDLDTLVDSYVGRPPRPWNILVFLLFDHIGGINTLLNVMATGGTATIPLHKTPEHVAELICTYRVTVLPTSPSFLNYMLVSGVLDRYDLGSLRLITYGTEPMPESLLQRLHEKLRDVKLLQTFGTSETGIVRTCSRSSDSVLMKFDDPSIRHKVVGGELWLHSNRRILGYLNHDSDAFTEDGWFRTGDLVEEAEDGFLRIKGRLTEIINVGGQKVFPAEVESVLLQAPLVQDCKVFGQADALMGQVVAADVVLRSGCTVQRRVATRDIRNYARASMDAYKVPVPINVVEKIAYSPRFKKILR